MARLDAITDRSAVFMEHEIGFEYSYFLGGGSDAIRDQYGT